MGHCVRDLRFYTPEARQFGMMAGPRRGHKSESVMGEDSDKPLKWGQRSRKLAGPPDINHLWALEGFVVGRGLEPAGVRWKDPETSTR